MQEGSLSLIQMAKSFAAAIDRVSLPVFLSQDHTSSPTSNSCALQRGFTFLSLLCFPSRTSACSRSISLAKSWISKQFSSSLIPGGAKRFIPMVFHTNKGRSPSASIHRVCLSKLSCCQHLLPASRLAVYQAPQQITNHLDLTIRLWVALLKRKLVPSSITSSRNDSGISCLDRTLC